MGLSDIISGDSISSILVMVAVAVAGISLIADATHLNAQLLGIIAFGAFCYLLYRWYFE